MSPPSERHRAELVCTPMVIEVGPPGIDPRRAFDLALEVVGATLPGELGVMPLSKNFNDFHVSPWSGRPVPIGRSWDLSEKLASHRDVSSAEPAFRCPGLEPTPEWLTPYEARATSLKPDGEPLPCAKDNPLWSIELTGIDRAWDAPLPPHGKGRRYVAPIKVAHPDTGYTRHHEIWDDRPKKRRILTRKGYDYEDDDDDAADPLEGSFPGHGTATASVIMSDHNPAPAAVWVSGAAPKSRLIPLRVSDSVIHFDFTNVAMAIHDAVATLAGAAALWLAFHGRKRLLKKCGADRLASVFREILVTHGFERPRGWDSGKYGAGILRADRLLEANLPKIKVDTVPGTVSTF